jgi:TolB protein
MTEIAASSNAAVITPEWSPDGSRIVFCTVIDPGADEQLRPGQADLWVMNADGTGRVRLTNGQFANLQPTWSAEGSIFFVSDRSPEGIDNVWAMRPDRAIQYALREQEDEAQEQANSSAVMVPTE